MSKRGGNRWPERALSGGVINETASGIRHTADSDANFPRGEFVDFFGEPEHPKGKSPGAHTAMGTKAPRFGDGTFWGDKVGSKAGKT